MSRENIELVRRLYAALASEGSTEEFEERLTDDALGRFLDPGIEWHPVTDSLLAVDCYRGFDGVRRFWGEFLSMWDTYGVEPLSFDDAGDRVAVVVHIVGRTHELELDETQSSLLTVRDGRVVRVQAFADKEGAREAAGLPLGLRSSTVDIETPDGIADAYLTRPDDEERHPGVLFIMDAYGLRPRIEEMADRVAARGYAVLAPNVFYRAGRAPVLPVPDMTDEDARADFFKQVRPLMGALTPDRLAADGAAYLDELAKVADEPVAIAGYCMGARLGLRMAAAHPDRVAALAGFHGGGLATDDPDSPHRSVGSLRAEVYFGHADQDRSNTAEQIAALDSALAEAGLTYRSQVYSGAAHGYTMSDTPAYDEEAAERHFAALFDLLDRTIGRERKR